MNQNGRSTALQRAHRIRTRSRQQARLWQRLFAADTLPVTSPFPHETVNENGRSRWFYTLNPRAMRPAQLHRLASHIAARQKGTTYLQALDRIRAEGWPIAAEHCELVDETAQVNKMSSAPSTAPPKPRRRGVRSTRSALTPQTQAPVTTGVF